MLSQYNTNVKQKKIRNKPIPLLITLALYGMIRASFVYLVLDSNPNNPLNDNSDPIIMRYIVNNAPVDLVCYSYDLLKSWLNLLMTSPIWTKRVTVRKVVKTKTNQNSYGSIATKDVDCLSLPKSAEISNFLAYNSNYHMDLATVLEVAEQIRTMLIDIGPQHLRLALPSTIPPQHIPLETEVTKPSNVVKQDRLLDLHYGKAALNETQSSSWDRFYSSETSRHKYLMSQIKGTRITDSSIRSLSGVDKEAYNNYAVSSFIANVVPTITNLNTNNNYVTKVSDVSAVNPALLALQHLAAANKPVKADGASNNKKYVDMIDTYFRYTRFKLDIKHEKAAKSLPYRMCDIDWMEKLLMEHPFVRFVHNRDENRPNVVPSSVQSVVGQVADTHVQQQPQFAQTAPVATNAAPSPYYNASATTAVNSINYPQQLSVSQPKPSAKIPSFIRPQVPLPNVSSNASNVASIPQQQQVPQQQVPQQMYQVPQQQIPQQVPQQMQMPQLPQLQRLQQPPQQTQMAQQQQVPQQVQMPQFVYQPQQQADEDLLDDELVVDQDEYTQDTPADDVDEDDDALVLNKGKTNTADADNSSNSNDGAVATNVDEDVRGDEQ